MLSATKASWDISVLERAIFTFITMVGAFMAILDTTIVDIIIPKLTGPLSTDLYGVQWVITSYMTAAACGLFLCEWLIKNYGAKVVYVGGVAMFAVASFVCGSSDSLETLIAARIVQGVGEAFVMVTSHIMIFKYYPPHQKGLAMGIFALGVSFAPAIGPTLGGYLTEYYNWRMAFYVNVPVGVFIVVAGMIFLPSDRSEDEKMPFNLISFLCLSIATTALLIALSKGQQLSWLHSTFIGALFFITAIGFVLYGISELLSKESLIDFKLFKIPDFSNGMAVYFFLLGFSMYQYFYLLPIFYEQIKGLPTLDAGIAVFAFAGFIGVFSPIGGILSDKVAPRYILLACAVIYCFTTFVLLPNLNYYQPMSRAMLLTVPFGIAMGLLFAPATVMIMKSVPLEKGEQSIITMDFFRFVGGSFGTAFATNNLELFRNEHYGWMSEQQNYGYVSGFLDGLQKLSGGTAEQAEAAFGGYQTFMASNYAFYNTFMASAWWGLLGSAFVLMLFVPTRFYQRIFR